MALSGRDEMIADIGTYMRGIMETIQARSADDWLQIDLTMAQLRVLFALTVTGPQTINRLAQRLGIHYSVVSHLVDRLVQARMAGRSDDPQDRRRTVVCLSEEGDAVIERLLQGRQAQFLGLVADLGEEDLVALHQGLRAMRNLLDPHLDSNRQDKGGIGG